MPRTKRGLALFFAGTLICFAYAAARTQTDKPQGTQDDQLAQLQMEVKILQAAIDNLSSEQQVIKASARDTHELVVRDDREIDQLGRQINSMMRDLQRVKTKLGLL